MRLIQPGDIQVFIDGRDIDARRAGLAMAAIDAVALKIVALSAQNRGIIPLLVAQIQIMSLPAPSVFMTVMPMPLLAQS